MFHCIINIFVYCKSFRFEVTETSVVITKNQPLSRAALCWFVPPKNTQERLVACAQRGRHFVQVAVEFLHPKTKARVSHSHCE